MVNWTSTIGKLYYLYFMFPQDVCVSVNNPNQMSMSCVPNITTTVPSKLLHWVKYLAVTEIAKYNWFLGMHYCLYVIQHSMAVLMVLILDGISPGPTQQGILRTHSGVQVESIPEVTYKYIWYIAQSGPSFSILSFETTICCRQCYSILYGRW